MSQEKEIRETVGFVGKSGRKYGVTYDRLFTRWQGLEINIVFNDVGSLWSGDIFPDKACSHAVEIDREEVGKRVPPICGPKDRIYYWPRTFLLTDGWQGDSYCLDCLIEKYADAQPLTALMTTPVEEESP